MNLPYSRTIGRPLTVSAAGAYRTELADWARCHADELRRLVLTHGAVRVVGLPVRTSDDVVTIRDALGIESAELAEHFADRPALGRGAYGGPTWAADREMCLHHEQSFGLDFPGMFVIGCFGAPTRGGAALLGDTRTMCHEIPPDIVRRGREQGWRLVRNFRPRLGVSWSSAYGLDDPAAVEYLLSSRAIRYRWRRDGTLHTAQRRPAVVTHPVTGDECWFNEVAFFSQWSIDPAERDVLLSTFGTDGFPLNTTYGDGGQLAEEEFVAILAAGDRTMVRMPWSEGDVLIVDNILTAHGREPYEGRLELVYAMGDLRSMADCSASVPAEPDVLPEFAPSHQSSRARPR
jgi:hypothetical protein